MQRLNFPLLRRFTFVGTIIGVLVATASSSIAVGFACLCAGVIAGLSWRAGDVPVVPFCFMYQWLFVMTGPLYYAFTGLYPGMEIPGDLESAVALSSIGLLAVALGYRLLVRPLPVQWIKLHDYRTLYSTKRICVLVILVFSFNWFFDLSRGAFPAAVAQIGVNVLKLRFLLLFLLFLQVAETRKNFGFAAVVTAFVILPELLTGFSNFKEIFFVAIVAALSQWRPWSLDPRQKATNRRILIGTGVAAALLFVIGAFWSGQIKKSWRAVIWSSDLQATQVEKLQAFGDVVTGIAKNETDFSDAIDSLSARMSSGVLYFSYVVERVPDIIPHQDGKLLWRTIAHVTTPRFLFPDKENLGGDSWIVRTYAGRAVAGDANNTSVGLGYLGEFYIDFGLAGVFLLGGFFGAYLAFAQNVFMRLSPSLSFYAAVNSVFFIQFASSYEGNFTKLFGGSLQTLILFAAVLYISSRFLHRLAANQAYSR